MSANLQIEFGPFIPVFAAIAGAVVGSLLTVGFSHRLQVSRYLIEYRIRNIEKTFVPILGEILHILENSGERFFGDLFTYGHYSLIPKVDVWENIKKHGLYEIMVIHDKKLTERIASFYTKIYPSLKSLDEELKEADRHVLDLWEECLKRKGLTEPNASRNLADAIFRYWRKVIYTQESLTILDKTWSSTIGERNRGLAVESLDELFSIAKTVVGEFRKSYDKALETLKKDEVDKLVRDIRKRIGKPI